MRPTSFSNNRLRKKLSSRVMVAAGLILVLLLLAVPAYNQLVTVPLTTDKARVAVAPYAQVVPNDSYTFIGVTHPSLDTALTQIGLALEVLGMSTLPNNEAGRATIFTIGAGETHRIFVVNQSHSSINLNNAAFTDSRTHLIFTLDSAQFGQVRIVSVNTAPIMPTVVGGVNKYANLTQLILWGVVFIESSGAGFAMEFVGDAHDSTIGRSGFESSLNPVSGTTTGATRGIN